MVEADYEVFDLLVERGETGYRARVLASPAGNAAADLAQPISEQQLESFLFRVGRPRRLVRRGGPSLEAEVRAFGQQLFEFLFAGAIGACLQVSLATVRLRGKGLRIQIRLGDVPELADLPWELIYEREAGHFGVSTSTPVVRFLETRQPLESLVVAPPLRVLVAVSSPSDLPRLDADREWSLLEQATAGAASRGLVRLERLEVARLAHLNRRFRDVRYHALHFIGHGDFDEAERTGELHFEDERGRAARVTAGQLAAALRDHRSLRLVVLNACEGARGSRRDPFAGTAQTLVASGVPAVIAMQFEVTDDAAIAFASEFYASLAVGDPVDRALAEARKLIFIDGNPLEWATPVLYLRSATGRLFDVAPTTAAEELRVEQDAHRTTLEQAAGQREAEAEKVRQAEVARREAEAEKVRQAEAARREAEAEKLRQAEVARREAEAGKVRQAQQGEVAAKAGEKQQVEANAHRDGIPVRSIGDRNWRAVQRWLSISSDRDHPDIASTASTIAGICAWPLTFLILSSLWDNQIFENFVVINVIGIVMGVVFWIFFLWLFSLRRK